MSYRWVTDDKELSQAELHLYIPVIYFDLRLQIRGGLSNQGQTHSSLQAFWTLSPFIPALITMDIPINSYYS